ncbi:MAG: hypothetical protein ABIH89_06505 [Elusimicrobiota bacterium]
MKRKKYEDFVKKSQWWSQEELEKYQMGRLKALLNHVYQNVPYYKELFQQRALVPDDFQSISDLEKIPILTRADVSNNFSKLIATNFKKRALRRRKEKIHTSGSTGTPMCYYRDKYFRYMEYALFRQGFEWAEIAMGKRILRLTARPFLYEKFKGTAKYELYWNRLSLSIIDLEENIMDEYLDLIKKFKPESVRGAPSALYALALYAQSIGRNDISFKAYFVWCENIYDYQKKVIEKQFNCRIYNFYASEEYLVYAMGCGNQEGSHIEIRKGVMEVVDDYGKQLPAGKSGRLVLTGFNNYIMPLIRYDIGDIGQIAEAQCSCGRGLPLLKTVYGRRSEHVDIGGKYISPAALSVVVERVENIKECQFIFEGKNNMEVIVVAKEDYSEEDTETVIQLLKKVTAERIEVNVNIVEKIPRTEGGKYQLVVIK